MSTFEKFGLTTGIIGLVADCIALLVFLSGIWTPTSPNTTPGQMPPIYQALLALTITYGWLSATWTLTRRAFVTRNLKAPNELFRIALGATIGIGLIVLPLHMAWWVANEQGEIIQLQQLEMRQETRTAQTAQAPTATPRASNGRSPTGTHTQTDIAAFYANPVDELMLCAPITHIMLGIGILLVLLFLMPLVYPDMPATIGEILNVTLRE